MILKENSIFDYADFLYNLPKEGLTFYTWWYLIENLDVALLDNKFFVEFCPNYENVLIYCKISVQKIQCTFETQVLYIMHELTDDQREKFVSPFLIVYCLVEKTLYIL